MFLFSLNSPVLINHILTTVLYGTIMTEAHIIDYKIIGTGVQFVEIELDPDETTVAEAGSMMYMDSGIQMKAILGDGGKRSLHFVGKLMGASKRLMTGESLFMTAFTNKGRGKKRVAFSSPHPGSIIPIDLARNNNRIICQRNAFLCCAKGISMDIVFNKKLGVNMFGGEGFVMQKLEGDGLTFLHAGGSIYERKLEAGETIFVDTGSLVAMQSTVAFNISMVKDIKSLFFSGEGIFHTKLTGPGNIWLQSSPFSRISF